MPGIRSSSKTLLASTLERLEGILHRCRVSIWYSPAYRLPMASAGRERGIEPRRADYVAWYLLERMRVSSRCFRRPQRVSYAALARVHEQALIESLTTATGLARVFAVDAAAVPVEETLRSIRLACGATVEAAQEALAERRATFNLLGGFHHASPARAAAFCPFNDLAVAVATVRAEGFSGRVVVLDLDAHPPDGTAECFAGDASVWIGSLSGADWGPLPGVDETVLPQGCDDDPYLAALDGLLARMPRPELAFVIAGGDVLRGDHLGNLGLSLAGMRQRDLRVAAALGRTPSVWLPGGGYHRDAWRALAGTAMAVGLRSERPIPAEYDPLDAHFTAIAARLGRQELDGSSEDDLGLDLADFEAELFGRGMAARPVRLLGLWTAPGLEYALYRYGVLAHLRRLGYGDFRVAISSASTGQCVRVYGRSEGVEHLLAECVLDRKRLGDGLFLFINWLTLRNPRMPVNPKRPLLPGQDVPGLGLMREAMEILQMMARRLDLAGVAFSPAQYHLAASAASQFRFLEPARQGRFEAMQRDLGHLSRSEVSRAVADERVLLDGEPYPWEASPMAHGVAPSEEDARLTEAERERVRFTIRAG
ncbi:MAG TPA: histone deacetylase [Haliangium sp.]|nr:histone deacetylase [Haliangium sp.]